MAGWHARTIYILDTAKKVAHLRLQVKEQCDTDSFMTARVRKRGGYNAIPRGYTRCPHCFGPVLPLGTRAQYAANARAAVTNTTGHAEYPWPNEGIRH